MRGGGRKALALSKVKKISPYTDGFITNKCKSFESPDILGSVGCMVYEKLFRTLAPVKKHNPFRLGSKNLKLAIIEVEGYSFFVRRNFFFWLFEVGAFYEAAIGIEL